MSNLHYQTPKAGALMRFFWKAAGGDRFLLERATYSDQIKYMCLGGIVVATGAMAGIAGGYAFYTIFSPKSADVLDKVRTTGIGDVNYIPTDIPTVIMSLVFGVIWGLIIFNIDRFIVTSTGKGDGTEAITWSEFKSAIPRIIMGMIIAITISKPVEIRMFKTEIDLAVQKQQDKEKQIGIDQATINYEKKVKEAKSKLGKIEVLLSNLADRYSDQEKQYIQELRIGYEGPKALAIKAQMKSVKKDIEALENQTIYQETLKDIKKYEIEKQNDITAAEQKAATLDGLLIRIQKAHEIAGFWISLFITLLFMAIELTPIFFKLMLTKTTYDYLAENRDELMLAQNGIEVKYDYYKDKEGIERHLIINHEAEKVIFEKIKLTEIQRELATYAVDQYKEREKQKIDNNLDSYIKNIEPNE